MSASCSKELFSKSPFSSTTYFRNNEKELFSNLLQSDPLLKSLYPSTCFRYSRRIGDQFKPKYDIYFCLEYNPYLGIVLLRSIWGYMNTKSTNDLVHMANYLTDILIHTMKGFENIDQRKEKNKHYLSVNRESHPSKEPSTTSISDYSPTDYSTTYDTTNHYQIPIQSYYDAFQFDISDNSNTLMNQHSSYIQQRSYYPPFSKDMNGSTIENQQESNPSKKGFINEDSVYANTIHEDHYYALLHHEQEHDIHSASFPNGINRLPKRSGIFSSPICNS